MSIFFTWAPPWTFFVYIEVQKGVYPPPPPPSRNSCKPTPSRCLAVHGYHQTKFTPDLWCYVTRLIQCTLVVDDVGVQYVEQEHAQHLIDDFQIDYTISKDLLGLCKQSCEYVHTRLYHGIPAQVSAPHSKASITQLYSPRVWSTHSMCTATR
jgi:hypothetical protein